MGLNPNAGANAGPAAKSAIDPGILIPEISLLLNFISGLPTTSLNGGSQALLPNNMDYNAALQEYFRIRDVFNNGGQPSGPDTKFLLELRDYLNSRASPAMGSTISFTTLVSGQRGKNKAAILDAQQAYPEFQAPAGRLRTMMAGFQVMALLTTVLVAIFAAYVYWGNLVVSNIAELAGRLDTMDKSISLQEATHAVQLSDKGIYTTLQW
ncbi:MAG: hypothetical protein J0H14_08165 [Alphaproteobacteria bacterium]|nr:hypothetical protein [Alphaproteobacteria bacterium]